MRQQLLFTALAFVLGLSVGGLVFGQRDGEADAPEAASTTSPLAPGQPSIASSAETPPRIAAAAPAEPPPQAPPESESVQSIDIGPMGLEQQMQLLLTRWASLERRLDQLGQRVGSLERLDRGERVSADDQDANAERRAVLPSDSPPNRRAALVASGVPEAEAEDIVWRESEQAMARLELQDRAVREGWFRSDRYFEELRALNRDSVDLRSTIGAESYDRYLYQTGEPNRVRIGSVIQGSAAERTGLASGDIIERYGDEPIFGFRDLREATTAGARDELVPVRVRRGDAVFETWIERGPIGVQLEAASVAPDA